MEAGGFSKVSFSGKSDVVNAEFSGENKFNLALEMQELKLEVTGDTKGTISGTTTKSDIDITGSSKVNAEELATETLSCNIMGNSSLKIHVVKHLDAELMGSSKLIYSGSPVVGKQEATGLSKIKRRKNKS